MNRSSMRQPESRRLATVGIVLAPMVWIVGVAASAVIGLVYGTAEGMGWLVIALAATLVLARFTLGWRSVPVVFALFMVQAPVVYGMAVNDLGMWLHHRSFHPFSPMTSRSWFESQVFWRTTVWAVLVATPSALLLRGELRLLARARAHAPKVAMLAAMLAPVAIGLATLRALQRPQPGAFIDSLPTVGTLPPAKNQPCAVIDEAPVSEHRQEYESTTCATPDLQVGTRTFHYHCRTYRAGELSCDIAFRDETNIERSSHASVNEDAPMRIVRDEELDAWFATDGGHYQFELEQQLAYVSDLRTRVAVPTSWLLIATAGLFVAALSWAAYIAIARAARSRGTVPETWIRARRGDCALVALGALVPTGAPLVAALMNGFFF
ncbi:MAG: hypothetical protein HOW73_45340 [Polyangiaceae bacterium]|nr:hypothetical protein [Polyangiaceae bacterium]